MLRTNLAYTPTAYTRPKTSPVRFQGERREVSGMQFSCYFRRGQQGGSSDPAFMHIANSIRQHLGPLNQAKVLMVGLSEGEEPLSVLSVLDPIARRKGTTLEKFVDLNTVDLRDPLSEKNIRFNNPGFIAEHFFPNEDFWKECFEPVPGDDLYYQAKKPIRDFLCGTFANPTKSLWETPVEDWLPQASKDAKHREQYDLIVYNNTHGYIPESRKKEDVIPAFLSLVKPGGIFITDPTYYDPIKKYANPQRLDEFKLTEIYPGIYKRKL